MNLMPGCDVKENSPHLATQDIVENNIDSQTELSYSSTINNQCLIKRRKSRETDAEAALRIPRE